MNQIGISAAITSLTTAALGAFVYLKNNRSRLYVVFSLYSFSIALWSFLLAVHVFTGNKETALFTGQYLHLGAAVIPVLFLHFVTEFFDDRKHRIARTALPILYCIAFVLIALCLNGTLVSDVAPKYGIEYLMIANPGYIYLVLFFVFCVIWALAKLLRGYWEAEGLRKNQIKYLLFGSLFGYLGGIDNFLYLYDITIFPIFPYGTYAIPVYVSATTYAILQYRLLDVNVVFKRSLIYALLLLSLLIPCYLLVVWGQKVAFGNIDYYFSLTTLILLIAVGFLFPKFRFKTEEALERALFKKRYDYRKTLLRSSKDMVSIMNLETLSNNLVHSIAKALGIGSASLFLSDESKGSFDLKSSIGVNLDQFKESVLLGEDPLLQKLMKRPETLVREEVEMARDGPGGRLIAERMDQIEAEVTLPLMAKERLIGILNLGHKEDKEMYSHEDLELLSTLTNQAAIAIENARLYENLRQSQSIIRRADRLSSLGMLTAGLAHEIRNPLVAIRTFTQLLPERYKDAEFRNNFQAVALKEVDRICGMVNDLLSFARPSAPNVSLENVNEIVESIARILDTEAKEKNVRIPVYFDPGLPSISIDKEQIKQVLMNFILNAIQAIEGAGVVELSTRLFAKNGSEQFVQIVVRDSGVGVAEKDLENIFNPFFTTKKEGSGLGLSISHQIVQEHGGYIVVESKVGEGTTFFINLPVRSLTHQRPNARSQVHEKDSGH